MKQVQVTAAASKHMNKQRKKTETRIIKEEVWA